MNPYIYVSVTILSVFSTYYLTHMNNFKVLREKWISELRNASCDLIEAYEKLYYANSTRYEKTTPNITISNEERIMLIKACEDAQAHVTAATTKLQFLFKKDDVEYKAILDAIKPLHSSSDKPENIGNATFRMNSKNRIKPQSDYIETVNIILYKHWNEISKSPLSDVKDFILCKFASIKCKK